MTVDQTIRVVSYAALALSMAGAVYCCAALALQSRSNRLSGPQRDLLRRVAAVKMAGIVLLTLDLAAHTAR